MINKSKIAFPLICTILLACFSVQQVESIKCLDCTSNGTEPKNTACLWDPNIPDILDIECDGECFVKIDNEGNTERGCFKKDDKKCMEGDTLCKTCSTDKCNNIKFPENRLECITCQGDKCASSKDLEKNATMCRLYKAQDKCVMQVIDEKNVVRGCKSDKDKFTECFKNGEVVQKNCEECDGNSCNKRDSMVPYTCLQCEATEKACRRPETVEGDCELKADGKVVKEEICGEVLFGTDAPNDTCYILQEGDSVSRGCTKSLTDASHAEKFSGSNSNNKCINIKEEEKFSCHSCNSKDDPKCAQWPADGTGKPEQCQDTKECIIKIREDKHIERRCLKKDEKCVDEKTCKICKEDKCNGGVFPENRLRCYQCDLKEEGCTNVEQSGSIKSKPCVLYEEIDQCTMYSETGSTDLARGCKSDEAFYAKCEKTGERCYACKSDNCNNLNYKINSGLKCIQCGADDEKCAWGYDASDAKDCKEVEYFKKDKQECYTQTVEEGKVARGCNLELEKPLECKDAEKDKCTLCKNENGCNNKNVVEFTCIRCRSDVFGEASCKKLAEGIKGSACTNPVQSDLRGCYTEKWNDVILRGCIGDLDNKTRKNCLDASYKLCTTCNEANCNNKEAPNSSAVISAFVGFLSLTVALLLLN